MLLFLWKIDDYFGYLRQHTLIKGQGGLKSRESKAFVAAEYSRDILMVLGQSRRLLIDSYSFSKQTVRTLEVTIAWIKERKHGI